MELTDNSMSCTSSFPTKWFAMPSIEHNGIVETTSSQDNE